jgi:hypothetical protein
MDCPNSPRPEEAPRSSAEQGARRRQLRLVTGPEHLADLAEVPAGSSQSEPSLRTRVLGPLVYLLWRLH